MATRKVSSQVKRAVKVGAGTAGVGLSASGLKAAAGFIMSSNGLTAVLAVVLLGGVTTVYVRPPEPKTAVVRRVQPVVEVPEEVPVQVVEQPPADQPKDDSDDMMLVKEEILDAFPNIYHAVKLEYVETDTHEGSDSKQDSLHTVDAPVESQAWDALKGSESVRTIEIYVKSQAWDAMKSSAKENLLYRTFNLIKARSHQTTPIIKLKFGDGRKDLDLDLGMGRENSARMRDV